MSGENLSLSIALADRGLTRPLLGGSVAPKGIDLRFVTVDPIIAAFRRMIRTLEFDVCELAPTTYLVAREAGIPITALPVFLTRRFHHGDIVCRAGSGIEGPQDLAGRRVGVRAYTVSTGVWTRGILASEHGVDLDSITWVVDDEEHVTELALPGNVEHVPAGDSIAAQFHRGELDAALSGPAGIGRSGAPKEGWAIAGQGFDDARRASDDFYPLFRDSAAQEADWYRRTGIYPIHGLVAVKTAVVEEHPWVATSLLDAFVAAKASLLAEPDAVAGTEEERRLRALLGDDPYPYGVAANEPTLRALVDYSRDQHILRGEPDLAGLFAADLA